MRYFWTRWIMNMAQLPTFELHHPWWRSGESGDGARVIICAAIGAKTEDAAKVAVAAAFDRDVDYDAADVEFSFCNENDGEPFTDRFPRADWMMWPPPAGARP